MQASDVMTSPVFIVAPTENVAHARNLMLKHKISRLPVMEGDVLRGIITKKDIGLRLRQCEPIWRRRPIDAIPISLIMTPDPVSVSPDTGIREIAALMVAQAISGVPIVENGAVSGIVTKSDLMKSSLIGHLDAKVSDLMEDAIMISRYHSLDHIIDLISERYDKLVVVNNDGTLAGVITETNLAFFQYGKTDKNGLPEKDVTMLRKEETAGRKYYRHVTDVSAIAEDLMTKPVMTITSDAPIREVVQIMRDQHVNSVVVIEGNEIKGIVKRDDIIREVAK
ncbi:MAG: CBS domain-containing protein [Methanoregulaceae archaeon]|nr:CBS domain-containing protein [Methanoregulaceae archaeon]